MADEIEVKGVEEERKASAAVPRAEISEGVRMCVQLLGREEYSVEDQSVGQVIPLGMAQLGRASNRWVDVGPRSLSHRGRYWN